MKYFRPVCYNGLIIRDIFERNHDYIGANDKQREKENISKRFLR